MKFYSKEEIATIKSAIRSGEKLSVASKRLSGEFNRPVGSVYVKSLQIAKEMGSMKKRNKKPAKIVTQSTTDKGVTLKNGFVFDFKPQRAEMFQDHVRLYF